MNTRITTALVLAVLAVGAIDVAVHRPGPMTASVPLVAGDPASATEIHVRKLESDVVIRKTDGGWAIATPYRDRADPAFIDGLLAIGQRAPDAEVDRGHLEDYGLDAGSAIHVSIHGDTGELGAFDVGFDLEGGQTFLRLAGDRIVRAQVGGRAFFDRPLNGWRDPKLLPWAPSEIGTLHIDREPGFTLVREPTLGDDDAPLFGPWQRVEIPQAIDQPEANAFLAAVAGLRVLSVAGPSANTGVDDPILAIHVQSVEEGAKQILSFGRTDEGTFVRRNAEPTVYQVSPKVLDLALRSQDAWNDRTWGPPLVGTTEFFADGLRLKFQSGRWTYEGQPANDGAIVERLDLLSSLRVEQWLTGKKCPTGHLFAVSSPEKRRWIISENPPVVCDPDEPTRQGRLDPTVIRKLLARGSSVQP